MEKTPLLTSRRDKGKSRRFEGVSLLVVATLSLGISLWVLLRAHAFLRYESPGFWDLNGKEGVEEGGGEWRWKDIKPAKQLRWKRCYENYDCAVLDVPLDWVEPSDKLRASIAVIRLNATIRGDEYKGAVFINPGGPGGSGIWFIKHFSPYYQTVVGKNYDIISFDPRGVGFTAPHISCLTPSSSLLWSLLTPPVLDAHAGILHDAYARAQAFSQACSPFQNSTSALAYVSTASTARDMYALVQATGNEKLNYWGFSYGTYLGVTFASLFPEKVGRMVNDGNVDAIEYTNSRGVGFIHDTEKVMDAFFHFCFLAGSTGCQFWDTSEDAIRTRLDLLLQELKRNPVIVPATNEGGRPEIIAFSSLRRLITSTLYRPLIMFPSLATVLSGLERGDGSLFLALRPPISQDPFGCSNDVDEELEGTEDAEKAIMCSDNGGVEEGVDVFGKYVDKLIGLSPSAGATMAEMRLGCVGWKGRARWRFDGPFEGNTTTPILFIANKADNVTPLRSAIANQKGFPGSKILIQDSYGHTSLSTPSHCTVKAIRAYFQHGTLPADMSICNADLVPFEPWDINDPTSSSFEDRELNLALRELMKMPIPGLFR